MRPHLQFLSLRYFVFFNKTPAISFKQKQSRANMTNFSDAIERGKDLAAKRAVDDNIHVS